MMRTFERLRKRLFPKPAVTIGLGVPSDVRERKPLGTILDDTGKPYADQRRSAGPEVNVTRLYACKGERIVCDRPDQHLIAVFVKDVWKYKAWDETAFDFSRGVLGKAPGIGTREEDCLCPCGGHWFAGGNYHFKDGWR